MVQWLRLLTSKVGGMGLIPGWGTKVPHATWRGQKKFLTNSWDATYLNVNGRLQVAFDLQQRLCTIYPLNIHIRLLGTENIHVSFCTIVMDR